MKLALPEPRYHNSDVDNFINNPIYKDTLKVIESFKGDLLELLILEVQVNEVYRLQGAVKALNDVMVLLTDLRT